MSDLFGQSYSQLDGSIKNRVLDFIVKLQERPDAPGLDLKKPTGVIDPRVMTARVTDFWRAVLIELPDSHGFILVAVKPHDDAYTYATRLRFGVNEVTGALEVVDQAALDDAVTRAATPAGADRAGADRAGADRGSAGRGSADQPAQPAAQPILNGVRSRDLLRFGVAENIAERLVTISDEDQFLAVAAALPAVQANAVHDLATGRSPDEVWADLVQETVEGALDRPLSRLTFTDGRDVDELRAVLEGDFKAWRVWLHPLQRTLAYHNGWRGPFRVTGGAGTGKTVTAIHRAKHVAQRLQPEHPDVKVLVTTFTKNLAQAIESQLGELAGVEIRSRVDVLNIDALAQRILARHDPTTRKTRLCSDDDAAIVTVWDAARGVTSEPWPVDFLHSEWSQVVLAQGISDRDEYLRASRSGRGRRLSRPQRAELWKVFERFTQLLTAQELMTFTQAASQAAAAAATGSGEPGSVRYRHAIIDEAQDLHPAHWRLLRALVAPGDDDLFLVGDAHQRIYGRPVVLSRFGIETRGRSRRLTVNYRTSREILRWSLGVMQGQAVDDLEGENETLAGARSEFSGPAPVVRGFDTGAQEKAALVSTAREWHNDGIPWSQMAIMVRQRWVVDPLVTALDEAGVPATKVEAKTEESALGDEVRVMTMHRAKGLEFRAVAVIGAGDRDLPPPAIRQLDGDERKAAWRREQNLLYVCGSRARERLYVSWVGKPSELLGPA
jgi:superfamily I DNA/RNA helicase